MMSPDEPALSPERFEQLVKQFYRPDNPPGVTASLQAQIQQAQISSSWGLPNALLGSDDQTVRFFGALTFMVKINHSASALTDPEKEDLLQCLVSWLIRLVDRKESFQVLIKICSTLATFFLLPDAPWTLCIRHLLCCFRHHKINRNEYWVDELSTYESSDGGFPSTAVLLSCIEPETRFVFLMFTKILAEDANRVDHSSQNFDSCHRRVEQNVEDATTVMQYELDQLLASGDEENKLSEILECSFAWMKYVREEFSQSSDALQALKKLLDPAIKCLYDEKLFEGAAEHFINIFSGDVITLDAGHLAPISHFLTSDVGLNHVSNLEQGKMNEDSLSFGQLIFHFCLVLSQHLMQDSPQLAALMDVLHRLTRAQSYDSIDQSLSNSCVEFWESYYSAASYFDPEKERSKYNDVEYHWTLAMDELLYAASLPLNSQGELEKAPSEEPFTEFRTQIHFAISGSFMEFDIVILQRLVRIVSEFVNRFRGRFLERFTLGFLEFTLYCISGLSDSLHSKIEINSSVDHLLKHLFESSIFHELTNLKESCPEKLRRRAIALIGDHEIYFRTRQAELLSAFDFLFRTLEYPRLRDTAARSIHLLASNSRKLLAPKVEEFLQVSERILVSSELESSTKERIVGSVAGIVREVQDKDVQLDHLMRLCDLIRTNMESTSDTPSQADDVDEFRLERAHETLTYLKALGKAFQAPDNDVISLDDDDVEQNEYLNISAKLYQVQSALTQFITWILQPYPQNGPLIVAACDVFRTGFSELQPGPFTFSPQATASFITAVSISNPCIDVAIRTAATFFHARVSKRAESREAVGQLLMFACNVLQNVDTTDVDPDLSSALMEFFKSVALLHENLMKEIPTHSVQTLLSFSIDCLEGPNYQPKKTAAEFWNALFDLSKRNHDLGGPFIGATGAYLTAVLVNGFGGNAARSELPLLTEPFRKMVVCERPAKKWIEDALFSDEFPSSRISEADKRQFLAQIMHLRGGRRTKEVVKDFWIACRGTPAGYG